MSTQTPSFRPALLSLMLSTLSGPALPATEPLLPKPTAPCPEIRDGTATFIAGDAKREVRFFVGPTRSSGGPLIFVWYPTGRGPESTEVILGSAVLHDIRSAGGVVAAPISNAANSRPWDGTALGPTNTDSDQQLMDEVVACATEQLHVDARRIHSVGFSAGGLKSAYVSLRRSAYIASVVVYSGGLTEGDPPADQNPNNKLAAMILFGGGNDVSRVDGLQFEETSRRYIELLKSKGRTAVLCNHGQGHSAPTEPQAAVWRFIRDHPFGAGSSHYVNALPAEFPRYCTRH